MSQAAKPELPAQILVCCYHKTGTVLLRNVLDKICAHFGLSMVERYGMVRSIPTEFDIVMLSHSLIGFGLGRPVRGIRMLRDPRDVWLSAYQWHLHCDEAWCVNANFDPSPPILYPRVPALVEYRRERWKRGYLTSLGGRSYQQNLRDRDRSAGMAFELDGYTDITMDGMRSWQPIPGVIDVRLEEITADFDAGMRMIFRHLGFPPDTIETAVGLAAGEDLQRMPDAQVASNAHVHSRRTSRWREALDPGQLQEFERRHGDVIERLGYRLSSGS